jgi:nitrogen fixation NifU-like protein
VTIACGSWLSEWLIGRSLQQARRLKDTDIVEALALPALKIHCAVTARRALTAAVDDYLAKRNSITDKIVDNA